MAEKNAAKDKCAQAGNTSEARIKLSSTRNPCDNSTPANCELNKLNMSLGEIIEAQRESTQKPKKNMYYWQNDALNKTKYGTSHTRENSYAVNRYNQYETSAMAHSSYHPMVGNSYRSNLAIGNAYSTGNNDMCSIRDVNAYNAYTNVNGYALDAGSRAVPAAAVAHIPVNFSDNALYSVPVYDNRAVVNVPKMFSPASTYAIPAASFLNDLRQPAQFYESPRETPIYTLPNMRYAASQNLYNGTLASNAPPYHASEQGMCNVNDDIGNSSSDTRERLCGKLHITNLDYGVTNEFMHRLFSQIGPVIDTTIFHNAQGKPLGICQVIYKNRNDAYKAFRMYNGYALNGRCIKIKVLRYERNHNRKRDQQALLDELNAELDEIVTKKARMNTFKAETNNEELDYDIESNGNSSRDADFDIDEFLNNFTSTRSSSSSSSALDTNALQTETVQSAADTNADHEKDGQNC